MRILRIALLAATVIATPLAAQRTADQARLSLGIAFGTSAGTSLWKVENQPIFDGPLVDSLDLTRNTRSGLTIVFHGTYFPDEHWGVTGEAMLLGLGLEDQCVLKTGTGSFPNQTVCQSINGEQTSLSAVSVGLGGLYRVWSRKVISPYLRANLGAVISTHSTVKVQGLRFSDPNDTEGADFALYTDDNRRSMTLLVGVGAGFTAALAPGYQLRWEIRDNIVGLDRVTGTTGANFQHPPTEYVFKHVFSVTFGFDVVLERRRGRRY